VTTLAVGDGLLAAGGADGTVRLIDLASHERLALTLTGSAGLLFAGDVLLTLGDGRGTRWDFRPAEWSRRACALAGRPLSREEWATALPGRPYAPACLKG
jgi:hypothetical protein